MQSQWEYEDEYDDSFDAYDGGNGADGMADAEGATLIQDKLLASFFHLFASLHHLLPLFAWELAFSNHSHHSHLLACAASSAFIQHLLRHGRELQLQRSAGEWSKIFLSVRSWWTHAAQVMRTRLVWGLAATSAARDAAAAAATMDRRRRGALLAVGAAAAAAARCRRLSSSNHSRSSSRSRGAAAAAAASSRAGPGSWTARSTTTSVFLHSILALPSITSPRVPTRLDLSCGSSAMRRGRLHLWQLPLRQHRSSGLDKPQGWHSTERLPVGQHAFSERQKPDD